MRHPVCIVKNRELVNDCRVNHCHFSPHKFIHVDIDIPKQRKKPTVISSRSINRVDVEALNHDLLSSDWGALFNADTASDQWDAFLDQFLSVFDDHAPLKKVTIRNPTAPPVSSATRKIMNQRRAALWQLGRNSVTYKDFNRSVRAAV